ncbi:MAG: Smr/MutS family protein [Bacteroidaceae bacterium]|nr:Smr/MutS family protein [Bacteroidaceae bacterium]
MVYPDTFERKIGFDEVRTQLRGRCQSALGTEFVNDRLAFTADFAEIEERLARAAEFAAFELEHGDAYEASFFDVREPLLRIRPERTYMEEADLEALRRSLTACGQLVRLFRSTDGDGEEGGAEGEDNGAAFPALKRLAADVEDFADVTARISQIIGKYGRIKDTASPQLLTIRHSLEITQRSISHSLRTIISESQQAGFIERDVNPTMRDGRLVIPVTPSAKRKIKGIVHDESATGKTVFIEPAAVVEANNKIRELQAEERREILRLLQELATDLRPRIDAMLGALRFLGHVDYLRALTAFGEGHDALVPQLRPQPCLFWTEAVHPLLKQSLEQRGESIVPLDIKLPQDKRILIISGPNAGGKSVCLKTVGLLQYMLQCGMPVPVAENSVFGIFGSIFIDIGDGQSTDDDLSTYSSHLLTMKQMMKSGDSDSLLLIDEFGTGTEPQIGGALAEAILHRFVDKGCYGVITTHYQNLKRVPEECPTVVNGAMLYDRAALRPLFRLQVGNPGSSFAIEIARNIGLPQEVIDYAARLVGENYILSDKYLQDIVRDKMYWENKRKAVHQREKRLDETMARYEDEVTRLSKERKEVMSRAREEAQDLLAQSNARIENTIREIRKAQAEKERTKAVRRELEQFKQEVVERTGKQDDSIARKMAKIQRRQERKRQRGDAPVGSAAASQANGTATSGQPDVAKEGPFAPGDYVRIKGQNGAARIESIQAGRARLSFGMMHTTVALDRLVHTQPPKENRTAQAATFLSRATRDAMYEKKLRFKPELDVRGMRADEAVNTVAYFLDDAIQLEYPRVRILHGTGTGALREAIRQYVSSVRGIRTFHDEHVQFGGSGITVVEI